MRNSSVPIILILGAGRMQLPAIRLARRKGWRVVVADADPQAPGCEEADFFENVDLKDREGMAEMAMRYKDSIGLHGVFTAGTDFSTTVAWVAQKCGLPGIPYEAALTATDKVRMRDALHRAGIACPAFKGAASEEDLASIGRQLVFPLVVKPVDSMGSRGVRRVDTTEELRRAFFTARASSRTGLVVIEQYLEGPELSLDAVVYEGRITVCGIADRHIRFSPYFVEMGHTMPSILAPEILEEAVDAFERGIRAIGIYLGAAKGDIKVTPHGARIGEIAARLSGGYMSGWTFPYSSGIQVTEAALNIAIGLPPGNLVPARHNTSAERAFISIPGKVDAILALELARGVTGIRDIFLRSDRGDEVVFPTNNMQKCGNVISEARTRSLAVGAAEEAARLVFIRLEPDNPETHAFLGSEPRTDRLNRPSAYRLQVEDNVRALCDMPRIVVSEGQPAIMALPFLSRELATDWHGLAIQDALRRVLDIAGIPIVTGRPKGRYLLGTLFWRAFLRGGAQGGLYVIDTLIRRRSRGTATRESADSLSVESSPGMQRTLTHAQFSGYARTYGPEPLSARGEL